MNYVYDFLIIVVAVLTVQYIQGFLFAVFKADKYEDVLAMKVAREVKRYIDSKDNGKD